MTNYTAQRAPKGALPLLTLVGSAFALQFGLVIAYVMAGSTSTSVSSSSTTPFAPDPLSDRVAAIAAEFRVNESGT